jgi:hypothetical protein
MLSRLLRLLGKKQVIRRRPYVILRGHLVSPYFLFIRAAHRHSDSHILQVLGLGDYRRCPVDVLYSYAPRIYLTEDDTWIHIADDCGYNLWHKGQSIIDRLRAGIPHTSLFTCSVGDIDNSFDFAWYPDGQLARRYVAAIESTNWANRIVTEDFGQAFPFEKRLEDIKGDERDYVLSLAAALGVNTTHHLDRVRCYTAPAETRPKRS